MALKKYYVARQMVGDKPYFEGDTRELDERDAKHLVARGALEEFDPKKHGKKIKNDAGDDDKNKADTGEGDSDKSGTKKGAAKKAAAVKE